MYLYLYLCVLTSIAFVSRLKGTLAAARNMYVYEKINT